MSVFPLLQTQNTGPKAHEIAVMGIHCGLWVQREATVKMQKDLDMEEVKWEEPESGERMLADGAAVHQAAELQGGYLQRVENSNGPCGRQARVSSI